MSTVRAFVTRPAVGRTSEMMYPERRHRRPVPGPPPPHRRKAPARAHQTAAYPRPARGRDRPRPAVLPAVLAADVGLLHAAADPRRDGHRRRPGPAAHPVPGDPGGDRPGRAGGRLAGAALPARGLPAGGAALLRPEPGDLLPGPALRRRARPGLVGPGLLRVAERVQPQRAVPVLVLHGRRLRLRAGPPPVRHRGRGRHRGRHLRQRPDHPAGLGRGPAQPAAGGHPADRGRGPGRRPALAPLRDHGRGGGAPAGHGHPGRRHPHPALALPAGHRRVHLLLHADEHVPVLREDADRGRERQRQRRPGGGAGLHRPLGQRADPGGAAAADGPAAARGRAPGRCCCCCRWASPRPSWPWACGRR